MIEAGMTEEATHDHGMLPLVDGSVANYCNSLNF